MKDTQLNRVRSFARGRLSITLKDIAEATGASEAAASARLRDLRSEGFEVECFKGTGSTRFYKVSQDPVKETPRAPAFDLAFA